MIQMVIGGPKVPWDLRSLETTVGEALLSNAWVKITVVVLLCL